MQEVHHPVIRHHNQIAELDGHNFGQDPGQPGKSQPLHLVRALQAEQLRAEKGSS